MDKRIQKYLQNELSSSERLALLREIESDEVLKKEFVDIQNMRAVLNLSPAMENRSEAEKAYRLFAKQVKLKAMRRGMTLSFRYAAAIILLVLSTYWVTNNYLNTSSVPIADTNTLFVPAGQRAQITLQDGTVVWLNAQSTLIYPSHFMDSERIVSISGEAYFDVAPNTSKPFIVDALGTRIKVLGTQFNIYCYPDAGFTQTSLITGSVELYDMDQNTSKVILKPNEQAIIRNGKITVTPIEHADLFLWKEGIYSFDDQRLEDIVKKLELYYDVKITISTPSLKDINYTCKFRQREGILEILQILSRIHKFEITINDERNKITLS